MLVQDLLEGHLAMQLLIQGHEDGAQAAPGVRSEHAEPLAIGRGRADGVAGGAVGVTVGLARGRSGAETGEGALDVGVADLGQALAGRAAGGDGGQALLGAAAVLLEVPRDQGLDRGAVVGVEIAAGDEVVGQAATFEGPGLEGGDELRPGRSTRSAGRAARRAGRDRTAIGFMSGKLSSFAEIDPHLQAMAPIGDRPR